MALIETRKDDSDGYIVIPTRVDFASALHWAVQIDIGGIISEEMKPCLGADGILTWASFLEAHKAGKTPRYGPELTWTRPDGEFVVKDSDIERTGWHIGQQPH